MKKALLAAAAFLGAIGAGPALAGLGAWHVHPSFSSVRDLACDGRTLYAATAGGLFAVNLSDRSVEKYTLNEGLGGLGVSALAVDRVTGKLYLGLDNGNLSVFHHGRFRIYTDFNSQAHVRFNKLVVYKGVVLIATSEGLSLFPENEGPNPVVYPTFKAFGTSRYFTKDPEIRDVFVRQDTIYALNRYFWAKLKIRWDPPLVASNSGVNLNLPGLWQTNGETGEFAYQVVHPDSTRDTVGYRRFFPGDTSLVGLLDQDLFEDAQGSLFAVDTAGDSVVVHAVKSLPGHPLLSEGDTLFFPRSLAGASVYPSLAVDDGGKLYVGTDGRGIFMPREGISFWDGEDIPFVTAQKVRVDGYGNVYYTSRYFPGANWENAQVNYGVVKFNGSEWSHIYKGHYYPDLPTGLNEFIFDPYSRMLLTFSTEHEKQQLLPRRSGVVAFDNPFLSGPVEIGGTRYDPEDQVNLNYNGSILTTPHIPTAITYTPQGLIYVAQSYHDTNNVYTARIAVYRDYSRSAAGTAGRHTINRSQWLGGGPFAGLRRIGLVEFDPKVSGGIDFDGQYNYLAIDRAGNIWAPQKLIEKFNVFGLKKDTGAADTLVFDINDNIKPLLWQSGREGIPESKRGLLATLDAKSIRVVKADRYGDIWMATSSGLFYYSEGRDSADYGNADGLWRYFLPGLAINDFDFDSLNNLWIATDKFGLKVLHYRTAKYYASTQDYGVDKRDEIEIESFTQSEGLLDDQVLSVAVHRKTGKVWMGFTGGLQEYESGFGFADEIAKGYVSPVLVRGKNTPLLLNPMANEAQVNVYTLSGEILFAEKLGKNHFRTLWDTKNPAGRYAATGVYLYKFTSPNKKTKTGKFAIVR